MPERKKTKFIAKPTQSIAFTESEAHVGTANGSESRRTEKRKWRARRRRTSARREAV